MNLSFGKIIYINYVLRDLSPSIPKFKLIIYTDKSMDKSYAILYTQNNKYVKDLPFNFFETVLSQIKSVFNLPIDRNTDLYYGDELFIELHDSNGKKYKWYNIKHDDCDPYNPKYELTGKMQKIYEQSTTRLFTVMMDLFGDKIPEIFHKKY